MSKRLLWILAIVFILGFIVRLYRFDGPVADWHSFRQGDTNAVTVRYVNEGINLAYPKFFDISNVPSGIYDNPSGYRFVEFPVYNAATALLYNVFGVLDVEEWGRLVTIVVTLVGAYFTFLLTRRYASDAAGIFAAIFYLFVPFSIFYGRSILPDPSTAMAITGGIYFLDKWLEQNGKNKGKKSKHTLSINKFYFLALRHQVP